MADNDPNAPSAGDDGDNLSDQEKGLRLLQESLAVQQQLLSGARETAAATKDTVTAAESLLEADKRVSEVLDKMLNNSVGMTTAQRQQNTAAMEYLQTYKSRLALLQQHIIGNLEEVEQENLKKNVLLQQIDILKEANLLSKEQADTIKKQVEESVKLQEVDRKMAAYAAAAKTVMSVVDVSFQDKLAAMVGKTEALARGAGATPARGPMGEIGRASDIFGFMGGAFGPEQRQAALQKIYGQAPQALEEGADGMKKLITATAYFGVTSEEAIDNLVAGSREANLSQSQIATIYNDSRIISKNLGLSAKEAAGQILNLTTAVRASGGSAELAERILNSFGENMEVLGMKVSATEKTMMAGMIAGMASMPIEKVMGLTMFTQGKSIQEIRPEDLKAANIFATAQKTFDRISQSVGGSYAEQLVATEKIGQLLGVNVSSARDVSMLQNLLQKGLSEEEFKKQIKEQRLDTETLQKEGFDSMTKMVGPLTQIQNDVHAMLAVMNPLAAGFSKFLGEHPGFGVAAGLAGQTMAAAGGVVVGQLAKKMFRSYGARALAAVVAPEVAIPLVTAGTLAGTYYGLSNMSQE